MRLQQDYRIRKSNKDNEEADNQAKEKIDKLNTADSLIFQSEKQLKEFGEKIPAEKREPIEKALEGLKEAHKSQDLEAIDKATEELNTLWQAASEELYKASQEQQAGAPGDEQAQGGDSDGKDSKDDQEVTDVDFEEVK